MRLYSCDIGLRHKQAKMIFGRQLNGLVEHVIDIGKNNGKIDQAVIQLIHQILCISAGDVKAYVRVFFRNGCRSPREVMKRPGFSGTDPHGTGDMVSDLRDLFLGHLHEPNHFYATKRGYHVNACYGFTDTSMLSMMQFSCLQYIREISPTPILFIAGDRAHSRFPGLHRPAGLSELAASKSIRIGDTGVTVNWEDNESVEALKELCQNGPLTIQMSMYGGFEQVGSIGQSLPRNDSQTTTQAGDIVLYSGNQIVVFYGSNSWAYTRLGHITDKSAQEMADLLGNGDVTITIER